MKTPSSTLYLVILRPTSSTSHRGMPGKTVLVESLVQRGYVEPYDDERVVHYFIPGTYSENEIASIFRNGIGKLEFYNLLKLRWIGLIFDSYKIPDSVPGLFSVNANKDFIYIDEQKTVTEYRRPVPVVSLLPE
ncbi:hypothetical protein [Enterobacter cloacae complex sp. 301C7]|uniref:hypothetical protein n=1 Tax=Enterobacter cloacae complex sp. 301C7 TaxID=3395848 RepID=UPI003CEA1439